MKICIYGAGAVGGSLAARLRHAGATVSVIARGPHGQAIREAGLTLLAGEDRMAVRVECFEHPAEAGPQDVVIVTVKGPQLPAIAAPLGKMLSPDTRVVFAMNGVPWWFGDGQKAVLPESLAEKLDPGSRLRQSIALEQVIGAVVYSSNEVIAPGVIRNFTPARNRMVLGRPDGSDDQVLCALIDLLSRAGHEAAATSRIRQELWIKMLIVVGASPVAALTGASMRDLVNDSATLAVAAEVMREGTEIGRRLGFAISDDIEQRLAYYRDKPARPSLLQDFEAGREPELGNGIVAFTAIAAAIGVAVPTMDMVAALVQMKAAVMMRRVRA